MTICNKTVEQNITLSVFNGTNFESKSQIGGEILYAYVIPITGMIGILGNCLNLFMLAKRLKLTQSESLERRAICGLVGLAIADMLFCIGTLPAFRWEGPKYPFHSKNFYFYWSTYLGPYYNEVWLKSSTWLTVVIAGTRYLAICHPLRASFLLSRISIKLQMICIPIIWSVFLIPVTYSVRDEMKVNREIMR